MARKKIRMEREPGTIEDAYRQFIFEKRAQGLSEKTLETYITDFFVMGKYLDMSKSISVLRTEDIQAVFVQMADRDVSRNTIRHYSASFKSFISWCTKNGLSSAKVALFKGEEAIPQTYTKTELEQLLKKPNMKTCSFTEFRNWCIVNLLVNDGCRAGTIRAIQIRDVRLDECAIYLRHTKRRKTIAIPLCDSLISTLNRYLIIRNGKPDDYLFCNEDGTQMTEAGLRSAIRRYNTTRGVKLCSLHAFRHTFARMYLVDCDGDALKLQRLLGHETLDITKHYAKIFDTDIIADRNRSPLEKLQKTRISMRT